MLNPIIWIAALVLYGLFLAWHENWRGPCQPPKSTV